MRSFEVYSRRGRCQRKQTPNVAVADDREKPEVETKARNETSRVNPPEALDENAVDSIVAEKQSVEVAAPETISPGDAKASIDEPSENPRMNDSDKAVEVQDVLGVASVDKNTIQPCPGVAEGPPGRVEQLKRVFLPPQIDKPSSRASRDNSSTSDFSTSSDSDNDSFSSSGSDQIRPMSTSVALS
ncbi:PREDICTED: transcription factor GTE4-like isoform X1 [Tarenaya hassleriana]|uniref:transcription factor GTE4-like isoform X1 n=1 Tax=Tarenaya hassleriana TaxID=28532 RepID=UPI00053C11C5|nr:PREDICTED: transcription factor GTE4-like isoform X1 [Tarenaya hassleriana]XP_019058342.1 PREDICTED: transcription factor GTE4-like isoform X1 [Tarenaya hassleriana]XP_019058343.1 PREDICTED: transcription factor GTE4-like isoform X1 [Tarenaya hassleriana]